MSHIPTSVYHEVTKGTKVTTMFRKNVFVRLRVLRGLQGWQQATVGMLGAVAVAGVTVSAHSGPPFPIVTDRRVGAYQISIWTDPDATDDRTAAGAVPGDAAARAAGRIDPAGTHVDATIEAADRPGDQQAGRAAPVTGEARQFVALVMDHEGPCGVRVAIDGPLGRADVDASTDATTICVPRRS